MALALLFCTRCGSHRTDVARWTSPTVAVLRCCACGQECPVSGFSVGRVGVHNEGEILAAAMPDLARPTWWTR